MKYFFRGNTGFNQAKREREVTQTVNHRMHDYRLLIVKGNKDIMECLKIKAEQVSDFESVTHFQIMIDVVLRQVKEGYYENKE